MHVVNMVKEFYTFYIKEAASSNSVKVTFTNLDSLESKYCTDKLINKIPDLKEQLGGFVFIKAQDGHLNMLNTLSIEKDSLRITGYNVSYSYHDFYGGEKVVVMHLNVIKVNDIYKIDDLW